MKEENVKIENVKILEESYSVKAKDLKFCNVFIFNEKKYILESISENGYWVYDAEDECDFNGCKLEIEDNETVTVIGNFIL